MCSYNKRKQMIEEYNEIDSELKKELKLAVRYSKKSINPVRLYYIIKGDEYNDEEISEEYNLSVEVVKKIRTTNQN